MSEQVPFKPTPEQVDAAIEANRERLEVSIEQGLAENVAGKQLHSFDELDQQRQEPAVE